MKDWELGEAVGLWSGGFLSLRVGAGKRRCWKARLRLRGEARLKGERGVFFQFIGKKVKGEKG
ncbi:hypothetical protein CEV08_06810 [Bartonella tribocorum]|uniref:Uncharacterized protein n=1 Tax=Bartonella tribocorum TaxID=85701 RepID=A0A2M6USJ3_9HYPH|nr:hypothetical protein CEV08_06810 [Bartonella tribocorum]